MGAVSRLFQQPGPGVTPLEESTIRGQFQQAPTVTNPLLSTAAGGFLPGGPNQNPFISSLIGGVEQQGDVARRQLASAAQRAGALTGTDYLNAASGLEGNLAGQRGRVLADVFEQERGRQLQAPGILGGVGQQLLSSAGLPRQVATEATMRPFQIGSQLLHGGGGQVIPGSTAPSPFASLIGGLAPFAQFLKL